MKTNTLPLPTANTWACEHSALRAMTDQLHAIAPRSMPQPPTRTPYQRVGGVAIINLSGPLEKSLSLFGAVFGGTSMLDAQAAVNAAVHDDEIDSIILDIDSPGGTVRGTADLADAIQNAKQQKPVIAAVSDMAASGAYWLASQASKIYANQTSLIGSIGTYLVVRDWSLAFAAAGVKTHIIKAGEYKGTATPGTEITDDHLADFQRVIDATNDRFLAAVARGRNITLKQVRALADGRVYIAADAQKLGLIDGVKNFDEVIAELARTTPKPKPLAVTDMTEREACEEVYRRTLDVLDRGVITCPERAKSYVYKNDPELKDAYLAAHRYTQAGARSKYKFKMKQYEAKHRRSAASTSSSPPTKGKLMSTPSPSDPIAEWDRRLQQKIQSGKSERQAIAEVVRENPDLHKAYLKAYNEKHRSRR